MADGFNKVGTLAGLKEGRLLSVRRDGEEIVLARVGVEIYALGAICSHADAWLDSGWLHADTLELECPLHEGRFDLRSGRPTREPPDEPVRSYAVRVEGDDILLGPSQ